MTATEEYVRSLAKRSSKKQHASKAEILDKLLTERKDAGSSKKLYESGQKLYAADVERAMACHGVQVAQLIRTTDLMEAAAVSAEKDASQWEKACKLQEDSHGLALRIIDGTREKFDSERKAAQDKLKKAMDLVEIGGGAVATQLAAADKHAKDKQWQVALEKLHIAVDSAEKVSERAPFIQARRKHGDAIKAAMGITFKEYGKKIKADWEAAESLASQEKFQEAADKINEVANYIKNTVEKDDELTNKRDEVGKQREQNVDSMKNLLKQDKVDLEGLKNLVKMELVGNPPIDALSKQATQVGDDPGVKTREPIANPGKAEELFKKHDWFELKDLLHQGKVTKDQMWDLWRFRQKYVTELVDSLRGKYPSLIAQASGSADLESDIDITFAATHSGEDVAAAKEFNATVKNKFGKPPGRVFDVNIYPRNYTAASESFNPDYNLNPLKDRNIDQPIGDMFKLSQVDQDVATLLKQRRFLDDESFNELLEDVLSAATDEETRKQIEKQFEEGEDVYLFTALEKVDRIATTLQLNRVEYPKELNELIALRKDGSVDAMQKTQKLLPKVLDLLEKDFPAEVMDTTDAMYLEKMGQIREDQDRIATLDNSSAGPDAHHPGEDCDTLHPGVDHGTWAYSESAKLKANVKKDQFTSIVFANEAYLSEGAIEHVVAGLQAKDPETKKAVLDKLTPNTLMQSCNEQLADFFKDMKHYEEELGEEKDPVKKRRDTGEAFVHASKYLGRLLDAAQILVEKFKDSETPLTFDFIDKIAKKHSKIMDPGKLKARVEEMLLALRKSSTIPVEVKGEVGVAEVDDLFGVSDITGFKKLITAFGTEINKKVRTSEEFLKSHEVDKDTERQFFGVPPAPTKFNEVYAYAEGEIEDITDLLSKPIPGKENTKGRKVLLDQFEEALDRATTGHKDLAKYDVTELHEAYQNDTKTTLEKLQKEITRMETVIKDLKA
jgi:hypothetical protein